MNIQTSNGSLCYSGLQGLCRWHKGCNCDSWNPRQRRHLSNGSIINGKWPVVAMERGRGGFCLIWRRHGHELQSILTQSTRWPASLAFHFASSSTPCRKKYSEHCAESIARNMFLFQPSLHRWRDWSNCSLENRRGPLMTLALLTFRHSNLTNSGASVPVSVCAVKQSTRQLGRDERRNRLVNSEIISVMNAGEKKKNCAYYFFLLARWLRSTGHQLRAGLETILKSSNLPLFLSAG